MFTCAVVPAIFGQRAGSQAELRSRWRVSSTLVDWPYE